MADVDTGGGGGGHGKHQKKRAKKLSTKLDMTPMVDLGFLLLTFFMLTTTFNKPKVIGLTPPVKDTTQKTKVDTTSLTVILSGNNKVYYYKGLLAMTSDSNNIKLTDFSEKGIRQVILSNNNFVADMMKPIEAKHKANQITDSVYDKLKDSIEGKKQAMFVIIKTDSIAKYVNVVTMLDEMDICNVGKYSLIDASKPDIDMIRDFNQKNNIK
ncbi:MAG TPA: biopolymer transporter ExbD [Bacteroidia bacterium]|nr:biopolymer transporter ExbD [Bacteroidia bacterium]